jgi:hypothetical protein
VVEECSRWEPATSRADQPPAARGIVEARPQRSNPTTSGPDQPRAGCVGWSRSAQVGAATSRADHPRAARVRVEPHPKRSAHLEHRSTTYWRAGRSKRAQSAPTRRPCTPINHKRVRWLVEERSRWEATTPRADQPRVGARDGRGVLKVNRPDHLEHRSTTYGCAGWSKRAQSAATRRPCTPTHHRGCAGSSKRAHSEATPRPRAPINHTRVRWVVEERSRWEAATLCADQPRAGAHDG